MKIIRSSKCSLRFITDAKRQVIVRILREYQRVVNLYIDAWWFDCPKSAKEITSKYQTVGIQTWFTARLQREAAREAVSMIQSVRERYVTAKKNREKCKTTPKKPVHRGKRMCLSGDIICCEVPDQATSFDFWLHFSSVGEKIIFDIPVKRHRHFNDLAAIGKRNNHYIITQDSVQFSFEIKVEKKLEPIGCLGIDTGINALASTTIGEQFGTEIKEKIQKIKRCQQGSKGQQRARVSLRNYINKTVKEVMSIPGLTSVVVEELTGITKNTKDPRRRLGQEFRRSIGVWNVRYWLTRLEYACERNRVSFRRVAAYNTSRTCPNCQHCHKSNRNGTEFRCLNCGYSGNADIVASNNILNRFLNGKYGNGCTRLPDRLPGTHYHLASRSRPNQSDITTFQLMNGQVRESSEVIPEFADLVTNANSKFF